MNDWKDCSSLQDLAAAQARGDEIEIATLGGQWLSWVGHTWNCEWKFRCRPAKPKTKTVVLREALMLYTVGGYTYVWYSTSEAESWGTFIRWTGGERTEEVPCD